MSNTKNSNGSGSPPNGDINLTKSQMDYSNSNIDMDFTSEDPHNMRRDGLLQRHIYAYMVGHFNNDLCASMWFIYLTYFLTYVVELPSDIVALALLSG